MVLHKFIVISFQFMIESIRRKCSRHKFTSEEDEKLKELVKKYGINRSWKRISAEMGARTPRQCRERYGNYLSPNVVNGPWSEDEDLMLLKLVKELGSRWCKILRFFDKRSDVNIKNRYSYLVSRNLAQPLHKYNVSSKKNQCNSISKSACDIKCDYNTDENIASVMPQDSVKLGQEMPDSRSFSPYYFHNTSSTADDGYSFNISENSCVDTNHGSSNGEQAPLFKGSTDKEPPCSDILSHTTQCTKPDDLQFFNGIDSYIENSHLHSTLLDQLIYDSI